MTEKFIEYASQIAAAYLQNHTVKPNDLTPLIQTIHAALMNCSQHKTDCLNPAVPIEKSVTDDFIICLEDGKKLKMMKRYLRSQHDMTPEEYRDKWGLPSNYPMVAPNYAKVRSQHAKNIGLGKN